MATNRRRAGILVPLFSFPSATSWGIGELTDFAPFAAWLEKAGLRMLQMLPLNEMAAGQQSPYSALSAMAIDPIYISLSNVPDFASLGGERALSTSDQDALQDARHRATVDYAAVRALKTRTFEQAFARFRELEWCRDTERAREFKRYIADQSWWLEEYALFRAIHAREADRPWTEWPAPLQRRERDAIDQARRELADRVLFYKYLQWLADVQWKQARTAARKHGVEVFGDLPFMVDGDSADVWSRQEDFDFDLSTGVPPDAFSATGQDWGTPVYRWDVITAHDFRWLRDRARRSADLYDGYRIDHMVGFYRTYARPRDGRPPFFTPADEPDQISLGERLLGIFRQRGSDIVAEDLGTVPDFVRESLARLGVPGFRVLRWERYWHTDGQPFRDPADYPPVSVATSGTHDTETLASWWDAATADDRRKVSELPTIQRLPGPPLSDAYDSHVRDVLLEALYASGSDFLALPIQDIFGWRDRINAPATVSADNWTFRLPWPSDQLHDSPEARERQAQLRTWADRHQR
jgi:4-alpha-glucanotransferase